MQGDCSPARAGPLLPFFEEIASRANVSETKGVLDQTHAVPLPVAPVESFEKSAGKTRTLMAGTHSATRGTVLDLALTAMLGLRGIFPPAPRAGLLVSEMHIADGTSNPARSEHLLGYSVGHFHGLLLLACAAVNGQRSDARIPYGAIFKHFPIV